MEEVSKTVAGEKYLLHGNRRLTGDFPSDIIDEQVSENEILEQVFDELTGNVEVLSGQPIETQCVRVLIKDKDLYDRSEFLRAAYLRIAQNEMFKRYPHKNDNSVQVISEALEVVFIPFWMVWAVQLVWHYVRFNRQTVPFETRRYEHWRVLPKAEGLEELKKRIQR